MEMNIDLVDAFILSVFCILIVFIILIVVSLSINLVKIIVFKYDSVLKKKQSSEVRKYLEKDSGLSLDKIKDEDMLIAAFVASIDAVGDENNKTVKIKSIKEI